ncbi:hypothetical protein MRX96_003417 [Rhipicephalus microplus]
MDDLPADHDVIVVGTGMPESIVAAAVSRIGQRVLHLDKESHYGGLWASYNLSSLREWIQNEPVPPVSLEDYPLGPGERLLLTAQNHSSVVNAKEIVNVPEKLVDCSASDPGPALVQLHIVEDSDEGPSHVASAESTTDELATSCPCPFSAEDSAGLLNQRDGPVESEDASSDYHSVASARSSSVDATYGSVTQHTESTLDGLNGEQVASEKVSEKEPNKVKELWSMEKLLNVSRKFNLDLAPKALKSVQKFLESLGRYGNSPFLASLYGSGELPQCFCRLCAVYGGIYHLQRGPGALLLNEDGACIGIVSNGRRFNCRWVVMGASYAPPEMVSSRDIQRVSRAIVISDESIHPADKEQITLLRLEPSEQLAQSVLVQEQGPGMMVCPPGLYVVHLTCPSVQETAEQDLVPTVQMLFDTSREGEDKSKPKALYILYFNVEDTTQAPLNENCPPGLILVSSPGPYLDYEHPVIEARKVFHRMYPTEEFLPRAPDPEEILLEHENNPGDHGPLKEDSEKDPPDCGKGDDASNSALPAAISNPGATLSGDS